MRLDELLLQLLQLCFEVRHFSVVVQLVGHLRAVGFQAGGVRMKHVRHHMHVMDPPSPHLWQGEVVPHECALGQHKRLRHNPL